MQKKLTEILREAMAKSQTEEGRRELAEEHERLDAEARQAIQKAAQATAEDDVRADPEGPEAVQKPPVVRAEHRIDPISLAWNSPKC